MRDAEILVVVHSAHVLHIDSEGLVSRHVAFFQHFVEYVASGANPNRGERYLLQDHVEVLGIFERLKQSKDVGVILNASEIILP